VGGILPIIQQNLQQVKDFMDVFILWVLFYKGYTVIKGTYGEKILMSLVILAVLSLLAQLLGLQALSWLTGKLWTVWVVALLILFQPELRRILTRLGQGRILGLPQQTGAAIEAVAGAIEGLSSERVGALICVERSTGLRNFVETGTVLRADPSSELIASLFMPGSPLHDGAVIVGGGQIIAAGCFLPLSQRQNLPQGLGTRHRAAMGVTEVTDAVVIVVSEETGNVSIVVGGKMTRNLKPTDARRVLRSLFGGGTEGKRNLSAVLWPDWRPGEVSFMKYFFLQDLPAKMATLVFAFLIHVMITNPNTIGLQ